MKNYSKKWTKRIYCYDILMSILSKIKSYTPLDISLAIIFILYILFPLYTPDVLKPYIDSPIAIVLFFIAIVGVFLHLNPILGILSILFVYELLRRNNVSSHLPTTRMDGDSSWYTDPVAFPNNTSTMAIAEKNTKNTKEAELIAMNPVKQITLEEEIVRERAPIGISEQSAYIDSEYKPVSGKGTYGSAL
jgi:hypothetical protein